MRQAGFAAVVASAVLGSAISTWAANYIETIVYYGTDAPTGFTGYSADFGAVIDAPDVTGVTLTRNGLSYPMPQDDPTQWGFSQNFTSLDELKSTLSAQWEVSVTHLVASTPTVSSLVFTLNLLPLSAADFPAAPTITYPTQGASILPGSPTITWTHPDPGSTDLRMIWLDSDAASFSDHSFDETTFSWAPGELTPGNWNVGLNYARFPTETQLDTLLTDVSNDGPLVWGTSPYAPTGWLTGLPLLATVGEHEIEFTVVPEPASLGLVFVAGAALLRRARRD